MEHKQKGVLIIGLGLVVLFGGILLVARCFDKKTELSKDQSSRQWVPLETAVETASNEAVIQSTSILDWQTYADKQYGFEFKYPKGHVIESKTDDSEKELKIEDATGASIAINVMKWRGLVIEEGTPGTFYMKLGYSGWKYFADNFDNIKTGKCDEAIEMNADPTGYGELTVCLVTKMPNYIKVEMDNKTVFHTKDIEVRFELGKGGSKVLMDEMVTSFKFSE